MKPTHTRATRRQPPRQSGPGRTAMMVIPRKFWDRYRACPHCGFLSSVGPTDGARGQFECENCAWVVHLDFHKRCPALRPELRHVSHATPPRCSLCHRPVLKASDPTFRKCHQACFRRAMVRYKAGKGPLPVPPA